MARSLVSSVRFYTRSHDPHNRQIVVIMRHRKTYRFTEGQMREDLKSLSLQLPVLRDIEAAILNKAVEFGRYEYMEEGETPPPPTFGTSLMSQEDRDWRTVQNLHSEYQDEVKRLCG